MVAPRSDDTNDGIGKHRASTRAAVELRKDLATVLCVADLPLKIPVGRDGPAGKPPPATIKLIHSVGWLASEAMSDARETSKIGAELVKELFPRWVVRPEILADAAYRAIIEKAEQWHAALICVGSQGRSAAGRLVFGSVSQNVLSHAPCSVRIGRSAAGWASDVAAKILLAFDGSEGSEAAAQAVCARDWPAGSEVRVITAMNPHLAIALAAGPLVMEHHMGNPEVEQIVEHRAGSVVRKLVSSGVKAVLRITAGDAKNVLLEEAEKWHASCIFLGAQGHSRLERFLLGSVSAAVAARAECSVEVVRSVTQT